MSDALPSRQFQPARKAPDPMRELIYIIKASLWSTGFISFFVLLVLSVAFLFAVTPDILSWIITPLPDGEMPQEVLFIIIPLPVGLVWLEGTAFQAYHFVVLGIMTVCFLYAVHRMFRSWLGRKGALGDSVTVPEKARSGLEATAKLFMAVTFFSFFYFLLLDSGGVSPETPAFSDMSTNELLYRLFSASVWEEIVSRAMLIGLPLMLIAVALKWERPYHRFLLGGEMRLNLLTTWLIIISAVVFAFAHVGSWDLWKVPQVLVSGMALGYAFVRFGLFASILLHFSINFVTSWIYELWPEDSVVFVVLGMVVLLWLIAGSYFFLDYTIRFGRKFLSLGRLHRGKQRQERRPVPAQTEIGRGFVCAHCGNVSARYENGTLTCLRCNRQAVPEKRRTDEKIDLEQLY